MTPLPFEPALVRASFPGGLESIRQWVLWRLEEREGRRTKVPYSIRGTHASTTKPSTWSNLEEALSAQAAGDYSGVGFVFVGGKLTGIDLDHCRDPRTGLIDGWAKDILDRIAGYCEISPSGTGIHVIVRATLPGKGRKRRVQVAGAHPQAAIEMYDQKRYFTVTGRRLDEYPVTVEDRQAAVQELYASIDASAGKPSRTQILSPGDLQDDEVIEKAKAAKNGAAFAKLWTGDTSAHGDDESAADLALCNLLAFWTGPDPSRIDRLFRRSGLYREKWEREDYRERTIAKALEGRTVFYGGRPADGDELGLPQASDAGRDDYVLIPGQHIDGQGKVHEVGNDDFTDRVLAVLPPACLFRMDFLVGELVGEPGKLRFSLVTHERLRILVDTHVRLSRWVRRRDGDPQRVYVSCSRDLAGVLLAAAGTSSRVRELRLLVHHPVYGPGLNLCKSGWNTAGGIYYDEPEDLKGLTPRSEGARETLLDLVVDFPLQDEASRENVFGAMLTVVLRPAIEGRVPFHLAMAPLERTGKGKLLDTAVGAAVLGQFIAPMQVGRTEEEREKRITSLILHGDSVVHLDNLPVGEVVDSASLASLATSWPLWRGRKLGVSQTPALPNNLVVFLSGNNVKATGEITKRTVPISLQPADDHPEDRKDFLHPDAEGYGKSRRHAVLEVLLGIIESWKGAGCPAAPHRRTMGGFERWAVTVGGILFHSGFTEWLGNYRTWIRGADEWAADAETLVEHWAETYMLKEVRAAAVLSMVVELGIFPAVTGRSSPEAQWSALGKRVLIPLTNRPVAGWRVDTVGKGASKRYFLRQSLPVTVAPAGSADGLPQSHGGEGSEGSEGFTNPPHARARGGDAPWEEAKHPSHPSDPSKVFPGPTSPRGEDGHAA